MCHFEVAAPGQVHQYGGIAHRMGSTEACANRPQHAQKTQKKVEIVARPWSAHEARDRHRGHSTNNTPPRDHPGGGDGPRNPHEPTQCSGIGHRCGRRAFGGLCRLVGARPGGTGRAAMAAAAAVAAAVMLSAESGGGEWRWGVAVVATRGGGSGGTVVGPQGGYGRRRGRRRRRRR